MSDSTEPETPAQRQARIRRQKREAKISSNAQDRLDSITKLSGRTPESMRNEPPATTPSKLPSTAPSSTDQTTPNPLFSSPANQNDPAQARLQEEYMRALFSGTPQGQQNGASDGMGEEDPMLKMMQQLLGGMEGVNGAQGPDGAGPGGLPFSPDDISKMTGIPSFLTNMFLGPGPVPPTEAERRAEKRWKILRVVLSTIIGFYTIWIINKSIELFGENPPAPATAQNPFVIFVMAELLVYGAKSLTFGSRTNGSGPKAWFQSVKDVGRDAAIVIFLLGWNSWWRSYS